MDVMQESRSRNRNCDEGAFNWVGKTSYVEQLLYIYIENRENPC